MRKQRKNEEGFTLVEMLAVLVIIAVLAAVAVPSMSGFIEKAKRNSYIAETRIVCTAVQQYLTAEEADGTIVPDKQLYEDLMRYEIGDERNVLTGILEGSYTRKGRIINVMFLHDKLDGIEYNIDGYVVCIEMNHEVTVDKEDKYFGK